jgi:hypothetical protein
MSAHYRKKTKTGEKRRLQVKLDIDEKLTFSAFIVADVMISFRSLLRDRTKQF